MGNQYVVGIDPSFTRTGLALAYYKDGAVTIKEVCSISAPTYHDNKYQLEYTMQGSDFIAREIIKQIARWNKKYPVSLCIVEYPVLATRSGSYLGLIQQALYMLYPWLGVPMQGVPSTAIKSMTKYKIAKVDVHVTSVVFPQRKIEPPQEAAPVQGEQNQN